MQQPLNNFIRQKSVSSVKFTQPNQSLLQSQSQPQPQPQSQPQPQPQDNTVSYNNWKKMNTNYSQMFVHNGQYNTYPQYDMSSLSQLSVTENASNSVQETNMENQTENNFSQLLQNSNRAKNGTFISNMSNSYVNYATIRPNSITSSLAIRKTKNSESSYM